MFHFPAELSTERFLGEYWQRKPLMMRQAVDLPQDVIEPDELAGLACEEDIEARIVMEHGRDGPWGVLHGPFRETDFSALPDSHWTLLVQDMDKHSPEVANVLSWFRFVPDWRIDDIMISYAADQGSVGPHTDDYDVFLIQARGRRRWRIHQQPVGESDLIPGLDLRILRRFETEQEWVLEPGDVLYLPPAVAHWGIAEGECMTWSVGFRAPSITDLAASWVDDRLSSAPGLRYRDPALVPPRHPGEVSTAAVREARRLVRDLLESDDDTFARWFCAFASEAKEHLTPLPLEPWLSPQHLARILGTGALLYRHPAARLLFHERESDLVLAASGKTHILTKGLIGPVQRITDLAPSTGGDFQDLLNDEAALGLLTELCNEGQLEVHDD